MEIVGDYRPARVGFLSLVFCLFVARDSIGADPVPAHLRQGSGHIFLALRGEDGKTLAAGESVQTVEDPTVTAQTVFHFRDGSVDEETTIFEQDHNLRLLSDHRIQRGPAFPHPRETTIDAASGRVTIHDLESDKTTIEKMVLPTDLANGIVTQILQNIPKDTPEISVSYVLPTSKPLLATLVISRAGEDTYSLAGMPETASKIAIKIKLGGLAGFFAPILGKEPKVTYAWMAGGKVPMFIRIQTQFYEGAPLWTIEQTRPLWPSEEK